MRLIARFAGAAAIVGAAIALSGCITESHLRLAPDFGVAVRQDVAAQIADPDARYAGVPSPAGNGPRMAHAVQRYEQGSVIQPATGGTSSGGGGGGGGGASSCAGTQ